MTFHYQSLIVFGVRESNCTIVLDDEYLFSWEQYDIGLYTTEVVNNKMTFAVYGIPCELNPETGKFDRLSSEQIRAVETLHRALLRYHTNQGMPPPTLGFYPVIDGNFQIADHTTYTPTYDYP